MIDLTKDPQYEAKVSDYNGCIRYDFKVFGRDSIVVLPKNPVKGNNWVWRAEFFDAFPIVDLDLMNKGWFLAYHCISDMYGNDESLAMMKEFHDFMVKAFDLNPKVALFGFSRGAFYSVNYTAKHPEDVGCVYLDAPVLDILSWPGGKGRSFDGRGSERWNTICSNDWEICKKVLHLTDETAEEYRGSPKFHLKELAEHNIPIVLVQGDADQAAPMEENAQLLIDNYTKWGATKFKVIIMPGKQHHPHSVLDHPEQVSDFITACFR